MPQYLMSVWHDAEYQVDFESPDAQRMFKQVGDLNKEMMAAGVWVFANGLMPASSATTFTSEGGKVSIIDGPYAGTKEQMGGFWVIEAADLDAALGWARKATVACEDAVELRPFQAEVPAPKQ